MILLFFQGDFFMMHRYYIVYKPYQVLSQFSSAEQKKTLKDFFKVPPDVYPVGRLDYDSEGLLILTNDKSLNHRLLHPRFKHEREYWVQVEGKLESDDIKKLETGLIIQIDRTPFQTAAARASIFETDPPVPLRNPPIRERKHIPVSWIKLILTEGKNRQVRKMTAAIGFPTLRLIRYRIEGVKADGMEPGIMKELRRDQIHKLLFG